MGKKNKQVMTFILMSWAGSELHSGFALQSSGCCWWTGLFCNLCVGCIDSLAEGNLQLLCVAKALFLAFCWQKKGSNCGPVNIVMHMLAQTGLCTPYAVCPNTQHLVPVFQAFHSLSSFLCRGILVSGMQFLWCHQCWV